MLYKMIQNTRDKWLQSNESTVSSILEYIESRNELRDAQVDAVKTYLFLKTACECKSLKDLFKEGRFNSLNLEDLEVSNKTREFLQTNPQAAALFEYSRLKDDAGKQISESVEEVIKKSPEVIDYDKFFDEMFYNVSYTDYLFSLPMGAGKTYLMAIFIYLDLYFAKIEPNNKAFAHNFVIFAPSGLKSSVIPSLKTIENFDPSWILPEPAASNIKEEISFELLDQPKAVNKSNKVINPNAQKIANHQPYNKMFGVVAVTNAEKVILEKVKVNNGQLVLEDFLDLNDPMVLKAKQENELRETIGKMPHLSIFVDEMHHAVDSEIKLRAVINNWEQTNNVNSVIGFSGTPFLRKANKVNISKTVTLSFSEISTIVYYYPLVKGVGNFLKKPTIKISDNKSRKYIIENGVKDFLDKYKDKKYKDGTCAKLGIYCGKIDTLEKEVYPLVSKIVSNYNYNNSCILKFHRGNKKYPQPQDSDLQFQSLDQPFSKIKIILLAQIGKEGWDCKSLTGIILSQIGDCDKNMVLQTSCRCLRQVDNKDEEAIVWLNQDNAKILEDQLKKEQHTNISEFQTGILNKMHIKRYDRTKYLKLPKVDFYQLRVKFSETVVDKANPKKDIPNSLNNTKLGKTITEITDIQMKNKEIIVNDINGKNTHTTFEIWKHQICKESFNTLSMEELSKYNKELKWVFVNITKKNKNSIVFDSKYDINLVNQNIRKAFSDKRDFKTQEEIIPCSSSLLNVKNFKEDIYTDYPDKYFPDEKQTKNIVEQDKRKKLLKDDVFYVIENIRNSGGSFNEYADKMEHEHTSYLNRHISYHYVPYKSDSDFEADFHVEMLRLKIVKDLNLEVYYNGDRNLTEFKIACYKNSDEKWTYLGMYTPDFLIIQRKNKVIHKAIIVETKGELYSNDPMFIDKKHFIESKFVKQNNEKFKYNKFDYLYLEDNLSTSERINKTVDAISEFFERNKNAN